MKEDLYLNDVEEETGRLFQSWAERGYNVDKMVTSYMSSKLRERIDKRYAWFCTKSASDQNDEIKPLTCGVVYDDALCEWLGYFYTRLQHHLGVPSKRVIMEYPFIDMYKRAGVLHDLDMDLAIKKAINKGK